MNLTSKIRALVEEVKLDSMHPIKKLAADKHPNSFNFYGLSGDEFIIAYYNEDKAKKIGFPDEFRNYIKALINRDTYCDGSYRRLFNRVMAEQFNKIQR